MDHYLVSMIPLTLIFHSLTCTLQLHIYFIRCRPLLVRNPQILAPANYYDNDTTTVTKTKRVPASKSRLVKSTDPVLEMISDEEGGVVGVDDLMGEGSSEPVAARRSAIPQLAKAANKENAEEVDAEVDCAAQVPSISSKRGRTVGEDDEAAFSEPVKQRKTPVIAPSQSGSQGDMDHQLEGQLEGELRDIVPDSLFQLL